MDKYLDSLYKFRSVFFNPKERLLLKKIALYIKGDISTTKLIENLSGGNIEFVVFVLNKVINDAKKTNRYFVELPKNLNFDTKYPYAIYAGDTYRFGFIHDVLKFRGPLAPSEEKNKFTDKYFVELTGDFNYPYGIKISRNDWLKIISKYPNLGVCLYSSGLISKGKYSYDETINYIKRYLDCNINEHSKSIIDIDSIRFSEDKRYFGVYDVMDNRISSFKDALLSRQK